MICEYVKVLFRYKRLGRDSPLYFEQISPSDVQTLLIIGVSVSTET